MLHRYVLDQANQRFEARRKAIAAIKTPEDIVRRQKELRAFFLRSLGDLPERTPLNPRVVGTLKRDGYRIDKVIFESRPDHHVTANLYLPEGKPPFPGVLVPCGHSNNAKAYEELSARLHPARQERHGRALLRPDRPGRAIPDA